MSPEIANSIAGIFHDFTPGAVGIWTGVFMLGGWLLKEYRETRKLSLEDRLARRGGYEKQVEALMRENREQREDLNKLRREYDEYRKMCHHETDELRSIVIRLEGEITGYKRKADELSIRVSQLQPPISQ